MNEIAENEAAIQNNTANIEKNVDDIEKNTGDIEKNEVKLIERFSPQQISRLSFWLKMPRRLLKKSFELCFHKYFS